MSLFDGKSLDGWKVGGKPEAFKVEDGAIVANGSCSHCFYAGEVNGGTFEDFELRLDVMTKPNSNGGVYIHTEFQESGWPAKGYEVQVNNTQEDWRKSGGLYGIVDNREPFKDNEWMKYVVRVEDGVVNVTINGRKIVDDYKAFASRLDIPQISFIPISALFGDNVVEKSAKMPWYQGPTLLYHLETVYVGPDANHVDARFPVQWVIRPHSDQWHDFRGYAGRVAGGVFKPGDEVTVAGPYKTFGATDTDKEMVFIGGGVGMAPLRSIIFDQLERKATRRKLSFWYGARSKIDLFHADEFEALAARHDNFSWHVALSDPAPEDAWTGATGFVHAVVFETYLKTHPAPQDCESYLCGPPLMVRAVVAMLDECGVDDDSIFVDDFGS